MQSGLIRETKEAREPIYIHGEQRKQRSKHNFNKHTSPKIEKSPTQPLSELDSISTHTRDQPSAIISGSLNPKTL